MLTPTSLITNILRTWSRRSVRPRHHSVTAFDGTVIETRPWRAASTTFVIPLRCFSSAMSAPVSSVRPASGTGGIHDVPILEWHTLAVRFAASTRFSLSLEHWLTVCFAPVMLRRRVSVFRHAARTISSNFLKRTVDMGQAAIRGRLIWATRATEHARGSGATYGPPSFPRKCAMRSNERRTMS